MKIVLFILIFVVNILATDTLTVAIHEFEPLIMVSDNGNVEGFEIDLLNKIAHDNGLFFKYKVIDRFKDLFQALDSNDAELAAAGITIKHSRALIYDFSYPHMKTGLTTLVRNESRIDILKSIKVIFLDNLALFLTYAGYLLLVSIIIYLLELKSDAFSDKPTEGIFQSFYFANTTATTTGYGDFAPKKPITRIFVIIFLFYPGIVFSGVIFGTISTAMEATANSMNIQSKDELFQYIVATVKNTANVEVAQSLAKEVVETDTKKECILMLKSEEVDAVVFDAAPLQYYAKKDASVVTVGETFQLQDYGFMFKKGSKYCSMFSMDILKMIDSGELKELENKWLK